MTGILLTFQLLFFNGRRSIKDGVDNFRHLQKKYGMI